MLTDNLIIGVGNPLLDILSKVEDDFLKAWDLKENDAILCDEKRKNMFDDMVKKYGASVEYIAGGSTQNSMRVCQRMLGVKNPVVAYMGCIGNDGYGKILAKKAHDDGINTFYQIDERISTGTCAVCIVKHHRSLCANLAAAEKFTIDHIVKHWDIIDSAEFFYIAGFFLTVCPAAVVKIGEHASSNGKCFSMNLSAPFLTKFFKEPMMAAMPYVDILFGNDDEMKSFAAEQNLKATSVDDIAIEIASLPKDNKSRPRLVIITQGKDDVILALDNEVQRFAVPLISNDLIVDTNGAGDAFVGGFFSQYIQDKPLNNCIEAAIWASQQVIQRSGCTLPDQCTFSP